MGSLLAFISALSYSIMYFLVRSGVRRGDPDGGAFVTTMVNVILLAGAALVVSLIGSAPEWHPGALIWFALGGLLGNFGGRVLLFAGLHRIGPIRASSITNTAPIFTIGAAVIVLGEDLTPSAMLATGLVVVGLGVLSWEAFRHPSRNQVGAEAGRRSAEPGPNDEVDFTPAEIGAGASRIRIAAGALHARIGTPAVVGLAFAGMSAFTFGIARAMRRIGLDEMPDALVGAMVGATVAFSASLVYQVIKGRWSTVVVASVRDVRPKLWLAGLCSTIGVLTFFLAIQLEPLAHVAVIAASETIITLVIGSILLRRTERLTVRVAIPAICVFAAGVLVATG